MKKSIYSLFLLIAFSTATHVHGKQIEEYEGKKIDSIYIKVEPLPPGAPDPAPTIQQTLRIKVGDPFSQNTFDQDLKELTHQYAAVNPIVDTCRDGVSITLIIKEKPKISSIDFDGNAKFKTKKLLKESELKEGDSFTREEIYKAVNKITEMYVKKGYFEVHVDYEIIPQPLTNEITIKFNIREGRVGRINKIIFKGFTSKEESELVYMIQQKRYNLFFSWLTGNGCYRGEEMTDPDTIIITHYLQNNGYADATVKIELVNLPYGKMGIEIIADKGALYHIGDIEVRGNELFDKEMILQTLPYQSGSQFSTDEIREGSQAIKDDLYGKKGYIETNVQYSLKFRPNEPICDVVYEVEESPQYRVGLIKVYGNQSTQTKVILNHTDIHPCQVFDRTKLKSTQDSLQSMGYFKSVNVYTVSSDCDKALGSSYRDVVIEVSEASTGNVSAFFGLSSSDSIFGGLDLTENNFNHRGLTSWWRDGVSSLRGAGEYFHMRGSIGTKEKNITISWMDPYFNDSLWRLGTDISYSHNDLVSTDYDLHTFGFNLFATYPYSSYVSYGWKTRMKNTMAHIHSSAGEVAVAQEHNNGFVGGFALNVAYDSTNNPFRPSRGIRSMLDGELAGVSRHATDNKDFPFAKFRYINSAYYPLWKSGTLKGRADFQYIVPFFGGRALELPLAERFFLGGEQTVRGYKPNIIGPSFVNPTNEDTNPTGGISSNLFSIEYQQNIARPLDAFVFFDAGSIGLEKWEMGTLRMSYGAGVRIDIGRQLPVMVGYGVPINPERKDDVKNLFFSMGGQF